METLISVTTQSNIFFVKVWDKCISCVGNSIDIASIYYREAQLDAHGDKTKTKSTHFYRS